jgi:hypothetical protein
LEKAWSYKLKRNSCSGRGVECVGLGKHNRLIHVLAIGRKEEPAATSTKFNDGCKEKPRIGSSSVPVVN